MVSRFSVIKEKYFNIMFDYIYVEEGVESAF
jgi:hypothetical protein